MSEYFKKKVKANWLFTPNDTNKYSPKRGTTELLVSNVTVVEKPTFAGTFTTDGTSGFAPVFDGFDEGIMSIQCGDLKTPTFTYSPNAIRIVLNEGYEFTDGSKVLEVDDLSSAIVNPFTLGALNRNIIGVDYTTTTNLTIYDYFIGTDNKLYKLNGLGNSITSNTVVSSVDIRAKIEVIPYSAFTDSHSLISVTMPDIVTSIGAQAFSGCEKLTTINIPPSVTSIGARAFNGTPWLTNKQQENPLVVVNGILIDGSTCTGDVHIDIEGITRIADAAFYHCSSLTNIGIPWTIEEIPSMAFIRCTALTNIILPPNLKKIGEQAFMGCTNLNTVDILSNKLTTIDTAAFYHCSSLTTVNFTGTEEEWNNITVGSDNDPLANATKVFNYQG